MKQVSSEYKDQSLLKTFIFNAGIVPPHSTCPQPVPFIIQGVNVPGLGSFTFSQKKLDVGNNKYILIQRPVFLLSEKLAQTHGLNSTKHHVTGRSFFIYVFD